MVESELQNPVPRFGFGCVNSEKGALFSSVTDRRTPSAPLGKNQCCSTADLRTQFILGSDSQKCLFIKE